VRWREEIPGKPKVISWLIGARLEAEEVGAVSGSCDKARRGEVDVMCYYVTGGDVYAYRELVPDWQA